MITVRDQIEHEKKHAELSAQSYYVKQDMLRGKGQGDEVDAARSIMRDRIAEVGETIRTISLRRGGVGGKYNALLRDVATFEEEPDFNVLAYMGVQTIFQKIAARTNSDWASTAEAIARKLEFEHKTRKFEKMYPGYYFTLMRSFEQQQVTSYSHMRNTLAKKMSDFDMEWNDWDTNTKVQLANKILLSIMHNLPDVFYRDFRRSGSKTYAIIETTPLADEWLAEFEAERGFLNPVKLPTLIKPMDWHKGEDGVVRGGYYSYRLSQPLIKAYTAAHKAFIAEHSIAEHISAINKLQATKWCINKQVLAVQEAMFDKSISHPGIPIRKPIAVPDAPEGLEGLTKETMTESQLDKFLEWKQLAKMIHSNNRTNKGKVIQFRMAYHMAQQYSAYEEFHYVYTADFRGRIYAETTGLSPQGNDTSKALLQFAIKKRLGSQGLFWLAVHGANKFGEDKLPYESRVEWVYSQKRNIEAAVRDPVGCREWWGSADKPWQFLAFCFDWAATDFGENPDVSSALPVGLDGSCNGIQHYSALLRDSVGGRSVNLINSELPADIYQDVSDELRKQLQVLNDPMATLWLSTGLGRKLTKRPVMTLPYGSTQMSARGYVFDWAMENRMKFPGMDEQAIFRAAVWLTPHLWTAIGHVVVAAREGMDWIQHRTSRLVGSTDEAMTWVSPVGFPVYQPYVKHDMVRVETKISGNMLIKRMRLTMQEPTEDVCRTKQRSGIAPNFVHSLDSSHLVRVVNASHLDGYAMIHDDFGTHAADIPELWQTIRDEFALLYDGNDLLRAWSNQQDDHYWGDYPKMGDLDVNDVRDSEYFFG